jgi:hypothetical protein
MSQETQMIPYRRNMQDLLCDSGQFHLLFLIFTPSHTHTRQIILTYCFSPHLFISCLLYAVKLQQ